MLLAYTALVQSYDLPRRGAPLNSRDIRLRVSNNIHTETLSYKLYFSAVEISGPSVVKDILGRKTESFMKMNKARQTITRRCLMKDPDLEWL